MRSNFNKLLVLGIIGVFGVFGVLWGKREIERKLKLPEGKTSFLVLGVPGGQEAGADLSDTMMWVSWDNQQGKVTVIFLPRDIWVPEWRTKLNSVYHYEGLREIKKVVSNLLGQETDYVVVIDYQLVKKVVGILGGVEVEIKESFKDEKYPIAGREKDECAGDKEYKCRYRTVEFNQGREVMDGERVLEYVRSRHSEGDQGTDFARSARQQEVIAAMVGKIKSKEFWLRPKRVVQLVKAIQEGIVIDFPKEKYKELVSFGLKYRQPEIIMKALNGELLVNPPPNVKLYDNQWVLIPRAGNWGEVREWVRELLE
jgi:LCP family protein required for cell wall assembly